MWNKYCRKDHPCIAKGVTGSLTWRILTNIKDEMEHEIWWQLRSGPSSFWFDNWTKQGALYFIEERVVKEELEVKDFISNGEWLINKLRNRLSEDMVEYITQHVSPRFNNETTDRP